MKLPVFVSTIIFLLSLTNANTYAQDQIWRAYSPPNKTFTIELPAPLKRVMSFEGEHGANLAPDQNIEWATCYAAIETTPEDSRFGVIVISGRARGKFLRLWKLEKYFESLAEVFVGDDDETQFLRAPVAVRQNGLTGKEYFYVKESEFGSTLYTRGRIFDTGNKIYVLVFVGQNVKDLNSADADRFLSSFRLRRRNKSK